LRLQLLAENVFIDGRFSLLRDCDAFEDLLRGYVDIAFLGDDFTFEQEASIEVAEKISPEKPIRYELLGQGRRQLELPTKLGRGQPLTVATAYPKALTEFAEDKNLRLVPLVTRKGSIESYPARGITDFAFDLVQSGSTKIANGLVAYRTGKQVQINVVTGAERPAITCIREGLERIDATMMDRLAKPTSSYASLVVGDANKTMKKVAEEAVELAVAARYGNRREVVSEGADLLQAMRYSLIRNGVTLAEVLEEDIRRNKL
jgi:phosphoribosyl-ATP pyrophosphohydrolase